MSTETSSLSINPAHSSVAAEDLSASERKAPSTILRLRRYEESDRKQWDQWIRDSKNGTFLFMRDYMEYHKDRFSDHSLIFTDADGTWLGVMPATINKANEFVSHGGLTYGGLVTSKKTKGSLPLYALRELVEYCRASGLPKIRYKAVPHIYHEVPAEDDLYALWRCGAQLVRRDLSSTIRADVKIPYSKGRKYCLKLAEKAQIQILEEQSFDEFFELETEVLKKHNTRPVHSASEMQLLRNNFPENIRLFTARKNGELLAGLLLFETPFVAHAQYMGASEAGKEVGALDALIDHTIRLSANKRYYDFGISSEQEGMVLNEGLLSQKEMFGARSVAYDTYEITL